MDIHTFHKYNRLVRRGLAKPLRCPHCTNEFILGADPEGKPQLSCYYCNTLTLPGKNMYDNIRAVVSEHFVD